MKSGEIEPIVHDPANIDEIRHHFEDHGFVVVQVLNQQECEECIAELWTAKGLLGRVDHSFVPLEWDSNKVEWHVVSDKGFFDSQNEWQERACWMVRQHPALVSSFAAVLQEDSLNLAVGMDRWGMLKAGVPTSSSWLHVDQNPILNPNFLGVQGLVNLTAQTGTSGGFMCCPGFHHRFLKWAAEQKAGGGSRMRNPYPVPEEQSNAVKVLTPAGCLIIWDSRIPHQNYPNESQSAWRIVQYVTCRPKPCGVELELYQEKMRLKMAQKGVPPNLTPLGFSLLCLTPDDVNANVRK
jgi:hypothetical protein